MYFMLCMCICICVFSNLCMCTQQIMLVCVYIVCTVYILCVCVVLQKTRKYRDTRNNKERRLSLSTNLNRTQNLSRDFFYVNLYIFDRNHVFFFFFFTSSRINRPMIIPYIHVCRTDASMSKNAKDFFSKPVKNNWSNERLIDRNSLLSRWKEHSAKQIAEKNRPLSPTTTSTTSLLIPICTDNVFGSNRIMLAISPPTFITFTKSIFWLNLHGSTIINPRQRGCKIWAQF